MSATKADRSSHATVRVSAAALACGLALSAAQAQSITNVGVPAGGTTSGAVAVSGNGAFCAVSVDLFGATPSAQRWSSGGGLVNLGTLPDGVGAAAEDISHDGQAISGTVLLSDETARAFRWTNSGGMQDLGLPEGSLAAFGAGISGDGQVVTGLVFDGDFNGSAFRWNSGGGMQSLGTLTGGTFSEGRRVNHDGSAIVGVGDTPDGDRAFLWTSSGGMQSLGLLSSEDARSSAFGISSDGSVVAGFSGANAVIWVNGVAQNLGMLPGSTSAIAFAVNGDGSLIGGYSFQGQNARAMLWSASLGLVDLNTYLAALGIDLTGWQLQYTRDISLDGTTIAGEGTYNGEFRGWVVTIPGPGPMGLLALGGLVISRRRRA